MDCLIKVKDLIAELSKHDGDCWAMIETYSSCGDEPKITVERKDFWPIDIHAKKGEPLCKEEVKAVFITVFLKD